MWSTCVKVTSYSTPDSAVGRWLVPTRALVIPRKSAAIWAQTISLTAQSLLSPRRTRTKPNATTPNLSPLPALAGCPLRRLGNQKAHVLIKLPATLVQSYPGLQRRDAVHQATMLRHVSVRYGSFCSYLGL